MQCLTEAQQKMSQYYLEREEKIKSRVYADLTNNPTNIIIKDSLMKSRPKTSCSTPDHTADKILSSNEIDIDFSKD